MAFLAAQELHSSTKRALECTITIRLYKASIAQLEFSLTTHFLLGIGFCALNIAISSCILLALYFMLREQA